MSAFDRRHRSLCLLATLPLLAVACAGEMAQGEGTDNAAETLAAAPPAGADAPLEVDTTPPIPLEDWRKIKQQGQQATRVENIDERIAECQTFVKEHPNHQQVGPVLETLADSMVEKGSFDPAALARCLELRADAESDSYTLPMKMVRDYHLKHGLDVDSGLKLLGVTRERIAKQWQEVELESDERRRQWKELRLHYQQTKTYSTEARLYLAQGKADKALQALEQGQAAAAKFAKDVVVRDSSGAEVRTMAGGVMDELHVLSAVAHHKKGNTADTRESMGKVLGFFGDIELRKMYDETNAALGNKASGQTVKAASQPAQDFSLKDLSGKTVKLSDYKGKVVLLTFWATWCEPCKKEMPELQKFEQANKDNGVVVLAINMDDYNSRSKIKPFLEKNNVGVKVLLEQPEQLTSYNYSAIPALYVIDREGKIAHARTGYDPQLKEKLAHEIKAIVEGKHKSGRDLVTMEKAPSGWGVKWQTPVSGDAMAVAIAEPVGGAGGEIGVVGRKGLSRWSADGKELGSKPLGGWTQSLFATDLDKNGKREWLVGGWRSIKVLDHNGESYWEYSGENNFVNLAGHQDLDGDGFQEVVVRKGDRVVVLKAVPDPMWQSRPYKDLEEVKIDPNGGVLVQAEGKVIKLDAKGKTTTSGDAPEGRTLAGRMDTPDGAVELFKGKWDPEAILGHDLDGDGQQDVVLADNEGVVAYDQQGNTLLSVRSHDVGITVGVGDLDGKAGEEVALFVDHYGLVVLGRSK